MPVMVHNQSAEWTQELYDAVFHRTVPGGTLPPGGLAHFSGPRDGGGWQVVDVWESREAYQRFLDETLIPAAMEIGTPPFDSSVVEIHNLVISEPAAV